MIVFTKVLEFMSDIACIYAIFNGNMQNATFAAILSMTFMLMRIEEKLR